MYAAPTGSPAFLLDYRQQLFVDIVVEQAQSIDACRLAERQVPPVSRIYDLPQTLRIILTGTAGTGKTVVVNEVVRLIGERRFLLPVLTGNAAVAIGGQVRGC